MAVARLKVWGDEILTSSDLNGEFNQVLNNQQLLGFPATQLKDFDGKELVLDEDGDTSITADTDDQIDIKVGGTDVVVITASGIKINGKPVLTTAHRKAMDAALARVAALEMRLAEAASKAEVMSHLNNF